MIFKKNKPKFFTMMILVMLGLFSLTLLAQEKEESKSKLDQLKGKVEKITVKVDGKDVVFEGKEAQKMADQLREKKKVRVIVDDRKEGKGDEEKGNVVYFKSRKDDGDFKTEKGDVSKKIKIEGNDGEKTVTITTTKDGKEETKTYKGEDAEKFLKDEKDAKEVTFTFNDDENKPEGRMFFFKNKMGKRMGMRGGCCCCEEGNGKANMKWMHKSGKEMKKMMKEDDDEKESVEKKVEKKIENK
jgi:hypothetical protein